MIKVEDMDFMFPWLSAKIRTANNLWEDIKNCRAVRAVRRTKTFIQNHPFVSLFLALSITVALLPFFVFLAFAGGSFAVVLFTAVAILVGVFVVAFAFFITVLLPILMLGGTVVIFIYLPYCFVMKMLKQLRDKVVSCASRLRESAGFAEYSDKLQFPEKKEQGFVPANEGMFGEEYSYNMNAQQQQLNNADGQDFLGNLNGERHSYKRNSGDHLYSTNREYVYHVNGDEDLCNHYGGEDYWHNPNGSRNGPLHY